MAYPIENWFRKPDELKMVAIDGMAITCIWGLPQFFVTTTPISLAITLGIGLHAFWRYRQGVEVVRFHRNLRQLKMYELKAADIPWSEKEMFIGLGFHWSGKHTQRLYQSRLPENEHLKAKNAKYYEARDFERKHPNSLRAKWTSNMLINANKHPILAKISQLNTLAPLPPVGGNPAIHGIEPNEYEIYSDRGERVGHTLVLGTTRVGKTRLAEIFITQDIRAGNVVITFDPKGDAGLLMRMYAEAKRANRLHHFYVFHLGYPELSARYSAVGTFSRITEVATRIANQLPGEGQSAAFKEFVWRFVNIMARAGTALGIKPDYRWIYENAVNIESLCTKYFEYWLDGKYPDWREDLGQLDEAAEKSAKEVAKKTNRNLEVLKIVALIRAKDWHDPIADGLMSVLNNDRSYFEKLVSSLYPLLEKLTTGKMAELLSPDYDDPTDPRPIFDWQKIIDEGGIVYFGLDSLSDYEVAGAVGNAAFSDLTSTSGRIYKYGSGYGQSQTSAKRKVSIHADEFNELIGDEFVPLLNKSGGAGYEVTVYTQTWSDVEAKIGSKAKADQIGGNLNTLYMLRVKNTVTAEILTKQVENTEIISRTKNSSANDSVTPGELQDFSSSASERVSLREVPLISPVDVVQLPKGQAFGLIEGGQLVKVRLPLAQNDDPMMPSHLEAMCKDMQRNYQERYLSLLPDEQDPRLDALFEETLTTE